MKKVLLGMLAVGAMTACSNEELVNVPKEQPTNVAIEFGDAFVNNSTRAIQDINNESLMDFVVYGYQRTVDDDQVGPSQIFPGTVVYRTAVGGDWKYDGGAQYWLTGQDYLFHALGPEAENTWSYTYNTSAEPMTKPQSQAYITMNNTGDNDLIFATAIVEDVDPKTQGVVNFDFKHLMSRVAFKFVNGMPNTNTYLEIVGLKITDNLTTGKAQINARVGGAITWPTWTSLTGSQATNFTLTTGHRIEQNGNLQSSWQYVFPTTRKYNLEFTVNVYQGGTNTVSYDHKVEVPSTEYLMNHSYVFTAKLDDTNINPDGALNPIEFGVNAFDWETPVVDAGSVTFPEKETE